MRTAALAAVLLMGANAACSRKAPTPEPQQAGSTSPAPTPATLTEPPLDRRRLLLEFGQAASAAASGTDDTERQRLLDGRPFAIRLRFGCAEDRGTDEARDWRGWRYDEDDRVLRIRIAPDIVGAAPVLHPFIGEDFESAEGFWLRRPWMLDAACPRSEQPSSVAEAPPAGASLPGAGPMEAGETANAERLVPAPRLGIVQVHGLDDARTHRRGGRSYEVTHPLGSGETPSDHGYDLVLSGRLQRLASGRVMACQVERSDAPPACVAFVRIDHVAMEDPRNRAVLAEWSGG